MVEHKLMRDAHKVELTGGAQTALHSHAGGNGVEYKAGTVTTNADGAATVTFVTAFSDTNYSVLLTAKYPSPVETVICMRDGSKTVNGFGIKTEDDGGKAEPNVEVDWLAIKYNNP